MKFLAMLIIALALVLVGGSTYANWQFMHHRPTKPDATTGRIHERSQRGKLVYLTQNEALIDDWAFGSGAILWLVGGYLLHRTRTKSNGGLPST